MAGKLSVRFNFFPMLRNKTWLFLMPVCLNTALPAFADDAPATSAVPAPATTTPAASGSSAPVIKGGVSTTVVRLQEVRDAGEAIHKTKRIVMDLYQEMTRHQVQLIEEPDIIGATVISIPISYDMGQTLPARKKWVDLYMSQLTPIIQAMQEEMADVDSVIPDNEQAELNPLFANWNSTMASVQTHMQNLAGLTKSPPYDQTTASNECTFIHDQMNQLEKVRKEIYKVVKKKG